MNQRSVVDEGAGGSLAETAPTQCQQCRAEIPAGAKLCRHCHSYQDWRGHMTVSSSVLALLVALLSVASVTLPALVKLFRTSDSNIVLSHPVARGQSFYLIATNTGSKPGIIYRAQTRSRFFDALTEVELKNPSDAFVTPGARQIGFEIRPKLNALDAAILSTDAALSDSKPQPLAYVDVWTKEAGGAMRKASFALSRLEIWNLLTSHSFRCAELREAPNLANGCQGLKDLQSDNDRLHEKVQGKLRGKSRS